MNESGNGRRRHYAAHNRRGIGTVIDGNNPPIVHVFGGKRERDAWVGEDEYENGAFHREPMGAKDARRWLADSDVLDLHTYYHNPDGTVARRWE